MSRSGMAAYTVILLLGAVVQLPVFYVVGCRALPYAVIYLGGAEFAVHEDAARVGHASFAHAKGIGHRCRALLGVVARLGKVAFGFDVVVGIAVRFDVHITFGFVPFTIEVALAFGTVDLVGRHIERRALRDEISRLERLIKLNQRLLTEVAQAEQLFAVHP